MFHIGLSQGDIGRYVLLTGDPGRCKRIAECFESPIHIATNREFTTYAGTVNGTGVAVTSTGIGGPSAAIAIEELTMCGADTFIRIGTCGGIDKSVCAGDMIVATAAIRAEGTSYEYAPEGFPAVADYKLVRALTDEAEKAGARVHTGVVQSKDSFYGQHSPDRMPVSYMLKEKWEAYKKLGVLGSEMECAALFTVASSLGVRCGAILSVLWNQETEKPGLALNELHKKTEQSVIKVSIKAFESIIEYDKTKNG